MSGTSNKMNPIDIIASAAEKRNPGCIAICASNYHLPVYKQTLAYTLSSTRLPTPHEEYIMKAADLDISYDIDTSMLPSLLGLDNIFLDSTVDFLAEKNILDKDSLPELKLTESGKSYLEAGAVPDEERCEEIEYYIDRKSAFVYSKLKEDSRIAMHPQTDMMEKKRENAKKYISRKFLFQTAKLLGKELEDAESGIKVTSIVSAKTTAASNTLYTEICLYDIINDKLVRKVWDYAGKCFRSDISDFLEAENINSGYGATLLYTNDSYKRVRDFADKFKDTLTVEVFRGDEADKLRQSIENGDATDIASSEYETSADADLNQKILLAANYTPVSCEGNYILCEKAIIKFNFTGSLL